MNTFGEKIFDCVYRAGTFAGFPGYLTPDLVSRLAMNGLYYVGPGRTVRCYMCGNTIQQWDSELSAFQQHKMLYKNCELSRTELQSTRDVAFNTVHSTQVRTHRHVLGQQQSSATASKLRHQSTAAEGTQLTQTSAMFRGSRVDKYVFEPSMCSVLKRLETFQEWPVGAPVSALDLAKAGFFFLGLGDNVQCFSCGGILKHWEEGDRPLPEHKRHFPSCDFVQREVDNIPNFHSQSLTDSVDGQLLSQLQRIAVDETSQSSQPAYPEMETEDRRITTFNSWPQNAAVQPHQLARAGFFYTGQSDNVKCFYCDGGLWNWETGDDPWREHAKWFPRCEFLLQTQGHDYVAAVQESYFGTEETLSQSQVQTSGESYTSQESVQRPGESLDITRRSPRTPRNNVSGLSAEEQLRQLQEERLCKVCMDKEVSIVYIPCGHLVVCSECAPSIRRCPICRAVIRGSVHAFMS